VSSDRAGAAHVCVRCAARGPTCCEPGEGIDLAPLGADDVLRISKATGRAPDDFSELRPVDTIDRIALRLEDPAAAAMLRGTTPRILKKADGACTFLNRHTGCELAYEIRPLHCRRFPFVRKGRFLVIRPGGECLAVEEAADLPSLAELLGTSIDELDRIDDAMRGKGQ